MCGRFVSASDLELVATYFDAPPPGFDAARSYNVSPTADIVAVVGSGGSRRLEVFRWGLVPPWSADPSKGPPLFNARSETASSKNSFRHAFRCRRCIVPADGFYEWPRAPKGASREQRPLPHYITRADGDLLAMAGLWERWSPRADEGVAAGVDADSGTPASARHVLHSATVLTTAANEFMAQMHERMPVLLGRSQWETWLDPANDDLDELTALCAPAAPGMLRSHPVSGAVGDSRNNHAGLIEPAEAVASNGPSALW